MKYLHSRLALAGVVVAWPLTQLGGCAQKDRQFLPAAGSGGDLSGGGMAGEDGATGGRGGSTGGKAGSGSGGKGGSGTGGKAGSGSGGSSAGKGGATTGGTGGTGGKGGSSTGGTGNTNAGGEAGQMVDPMCEPTGVEVCADGVDNDCDNLTDCLAVVSTFPEENGAAAGAHVYYTFQPKHSTATFQCRAIKGDSMPTTTPWGTCARVSGNTAFPITGAATTDDSTNGVWTTEVRLTFPDGSHSRSFRRQVYVHNSLNLDTPCPALPSDDEFFAVATPNLDDTGAFDQSTVRNPFIQITFTPPLDGRYYVYSGDGAVRAYSLRRRFAFDDTGHFLIMTRTYPSRLGGSGCVVAQKRVHNTRGTWALGFHSYQNCAAFVMNTAGQGYCLTTASGTGAPISAEWVRQDFGVQLDDSLYNRNADNFAWRKIFMSRNIYGYQTNFSPACDVDGCQLTNTSALFLPDAALYTYW